MRKILYSSGYGAGWSSTNGSTKEEMRWLCEYKPFIEYLEVYGSFPKVERTGFGDEYETTDLGRQFIKDWKAAFPDSPVPYLGGMKKLKVHTIEDDEQYRINEYDGKERVITRNEAEDEWL